MGLKVYKITDFNHIAEKKQFERVKAFLKNKYNDSVDPCILIGNYNINGVELHALIVSRSGFCILEFKNWGGDIIARENDSWTADGVTIEGGSAQITPFTQISYNRNQTTKGLNRILGIPGSSVCASIIFYKDSHIDISSLSDTVCTWLTVLDDAHLSKLDNWLSKYIYESEFVESIPLHLGILDYEVGLSNKKNGIASEVYEPEAATIMYEELERTLGYLPDYETVYRNFNRVFRQCLDQKINATRLNFSGTFAKTDYLLKEYQASRNLSKNVNDTRNRLRKKDELSISELSDNCFYDLENLCRFISFIYKVDIPDSLSSQFPRIAKKHKEKKLLSEYTRVIIEKWDDKYVYVQSDEAEKDSLKVCYVDNNPNNQYNNGDWSYLKDYFFKGAQMNLIRPREDVGVIYPELIIFEPDYLINITAIARCFTTYDESPLVDLINKIEPFQTSEAILLGNFAGQLLDESIHQLPNTHSYEISAKEFFKNNAIELLTANPGVTFHQNAKSQKQNIGNAINIALPSSLGRFDSKEGLVEPSFFSEMLGIQGRMDYLQMDYKVLLEQKSGKGNWPYDDFIKPRIKEEHYIQILLYMALIRYNYRTIYEKNNRELHAFLLYSKYIESLLGIGFAPKLIFRAIKIRNGIAWKEFLYTKPSGYRLLESITPEELNSKKVNDYLWNTYTRPHLDELLSPIGRASDLEKAYYFRFLTFIANEHMMSKLGSKTKESSGFASIWNDQLEDKRLSGNIYDNLSLISPNKQTQDVIKEVVLGFNETPDNDMSNFRTGDIVILYPYKKGTEPDARSTMVFRCTIKSIDIDKITLSLRFAQTDNRVFIRNEHSMWAIEHDLMDSSFTSLYKGMHAFLSAPKDRRDLILTQREPKTDQNVTLKGNYGNFNNLVLKVKQAQELFLIIGPPGTGKTSFGMLYTVKEELMEPNSSILIMSYTNRAVDEICSKLQNEGISFIRVGGELSCNEKYKNCLISSKVQNCKNKVEFREIITQSRVFVGTTTAINSHLSLLQLKQFTLAVIDEASQILEPHVIGIFSAHNNGVPAVKKIVMIGDHKQLPAVVQQEETISVVQDVLLNNISLKDCRLSLFERLLNRYGDENKKVVHMLNEQGRMHHDIAIFPNVTFYDNKLKEVSSEHQQKTLLKKCKGNNGIEDLLTTRRIVFISVKAPKKTPSDKVNQNEADIIAATVFKIYELEKDNFDVNETVGVIVPYRNQIATVRNTIDKRGPNILHNITIDTVERFQGSQRNYIIYGFTVQKYYQLRFLTGNVFEDSKGNIIDRKLNVAMTRAKEHLIMVGNSEILANNFTYFKLMEFVKSKQSYFSIDVKDYVSGNFTISDYNMEDIDLSKAIFTTSTQFDRVFNRHVLTPIKEDKRTVWPSLIFGNDMASNLNAIGYGRINFSNQLRFFENLSPEYQVLIYCYYIMRQHYCSSLNIYNSYKVWLIEQIESVSGRVQMIDIGCGPATCGIAFSEVFLYKAPNMVYTGIDVSSAMKNMGRLLLSEHSDRMKFQMKTSFNELDINFWKGCSELPSLIIFNISYFFSNVSQKFSEDLGQKIVDIMKKHPLNKYIFIIQHSEHDHNLESYKVFKGILSSHIDIYQQKKSSFSYQLRYQTMNLYFFYDIYTSK